jgi:hypothetical protein
MKPRFLVPADIKDRNGQPLRECDLAHVFHESQKLGRRVTSLEVLNIQGSLVKPLYNEASEVLHSINAEIAQEPEGTFRWQRLDGARRKVRGFYNTCKQVWAVRKPEYDEQLKEKAAGMPNRKARRAAQFKQEPLTTDQIIDELMAQAQAQCWSDQLLHMRITARLQEVG